MIWYKTESQTHGIKIRRLEFACADGPVVARVWDYGGQHVLHAMHEFFLTQRCLYLLVLEQRTDRTERDAKYWLQLIRSYAGDAPEGKLPGNLFPRGLLPRIPVRAMSGVSPVAFGSVRV